jgi:hypothetical protein
MIDPLSKLGPKIVKEQNAYLRGMHLSELELLRGSARPKRFLVRQWFFVAGCFLVGVVVLTALVVGWKKTFARLTYQIQPRGNALGASSSATSEGKIGRWVAARDGQTSVIAFSDGSKLWLSSGARLRVMDLGRSHADLALEQGATQVRVEGTRLTEYHLWVGPFELTLPKGSAQVTWDPMTLQLDLVVQEGYVVIAGCQFGQGRSVAAGKELGTRCSEP